MLGQTKNFYILELSRPAPYPGSTIVSDKHQA